MDRVNQHHVWKSYLEAWAVNGTFVCRRAGRVFECQPKNVANKRYFYRIEELAGSELAFIEGAFLSQMPPFLQQINRRWLHMINAPFGEIDRLRTQGLDPQKLDVVRKGIENNILEEIHGKIESSGGRYLKCIRNSDFSFFLSEEARIEFLLFLTVQYFRTNKMKVCVLDKSGREIMERLGYDLEKIWNPLSYVFATSLSYSLSSDNSTRLTLLENRTGVSFLTGDQPVLNTRATNLHRGQQVQDLELYYPVSPSVAVLVTARETSYSSRVVRLDEQEVKAYNEHIVKHALTDLYSCSKQQLEAISD